MDSIALERATVPNPTRPISGDGSADRAIQQRALRRKM
jgi:hypothetical protein